MSEDHNLTVCGKILSREGGQAAPRPLRV